MRPGGSFTERSTHDSPLAVGYDFLGAGEPVQALRCFEEAAAIASEAEVDAARAEALLALSRVDEAIAAWAAAVEREPSSVIYRLGLGEAHRIAGSLQDAVESFEQAARLRPDSARVHLLLGRALFEQGDLAEAINRYREAIHLDGESREAICELGLILIGQSKEAEGIALLERCARRYPDDAAVRYELGKAWNSLCETERARGYLARYLELEPGDSLDAASLLQRIAREETALHSGEAALPASYVRALFDQYAGRFDDALRSLLDYRAPELIKSLIEPLLVAQEIAAGSLQVLDLGCGTGLSGEPLRSWARNLCGVDLSPSMIEEARKRSLYDSLRVGDLESVLSEEAARWDLIVACDTLVYVGDLHKVFALAFEALVPGGWLVATLETPEGSGEIEFKETRRFGHAESYLRKLADENGYQIRDLIAGPLRREAGRLLSGIGIVLERPRTRPGQIGDAHQAGVSRGYSRA